MYKHVKQATACNQDRLWLVNKLNLDSSAEDIDRLRTLIQVSKLKHLNVTVFLGNSVQESLDPTKTVGLLYMALMTRIYNIKLT